VNQFTKSGEKLQTVTVVLDSELLPGAGQRANTDHDGIAAAFGQIIGGFGSARLSR